MGPRGPGRQVGVQERNVYRRVCCFLLNVYHSPHAYCIVQRDTCGQGTVAGIAHQTHCCSRGSASVLKQSLFWAMHYRFNCPHASADCPCATLPCCWPAAAACVLQLSWLLAASCCCAAARSPTRSCLCCQALAPSSSWQRQASRLWQSLRVLARTCRTTQQHSGHQSECLPCCCGLSI